MTNRIDAVYALIANKDKTKVLLVLNKDNGQWTLPGGAVKKRENLSSAVLREVKEETGLDVAPKELVIINEVIFRNNNNHAIFFTFSAEIVGGSEQISRPQEIEALDWIEIDRANELLPYYGGKISDLLQSNYGIEYVNQGELL